MKISVITVSYNSGETILDTIKSVVNQTYKNIEYIIIDGGSTDNTLDIINEYKNNINIIVSEPDYGIYDAMNKGIELATGEIIGILNSDDMYYDCDVIKNVMSKFINNSQADIVYGNLVYVEKNNINKIVRKWNSISYYSKYFENANVPPHPSLFLKKNVYLNSGKFNLNYKFASDYEFMLRIFKLSNYTIFFEPIVMIKMRLGGATNVSFKNIFLGNLEIYRAWKKNNLKIPIYFFPLKVIKRLLQFL